ncbi:MAG: KH domain-containing protein, partial [Desulfovibrio sp.]|nr:KH domain-containing protein [Desulfovibrio sp.]
RGGKPRSRPTNSRFKPEPRKFARDNDAKLSRVDGERKDEPELEEELIENEGDSSMISPVEVDKELLEKSAREIVSKLLTPIAGKELELSVEITPGAARVKAPWEGDAGLLIGREGQTLAAVQYIASRILSRTMNAPLKLQIDIGDYRSRQEDKLCEIARSLAEKAQSQGRPFSTRPLSSFHRRIVHLCLQDFEDIQTRSSGDGPLKKVLIFPKKNGRS